MSDLTFLYYSSCRITDFFANNIRQHILSLSNGASIVSVTHKPIDFGHNICVGDIGISSWNIYYQILLGAKEVKTKYLVCVEDDSMYIPDHFKYRPKDDEFAYNTHRWNVNPDIYYYREGRAGMCMCIAPTELLVSTLEVRFKKYTKEAYSEVYHLPNFGEPGRCEKKLGLPLVKMSTFKTELSTLTFNHRPSYGGMRRPLAKDTLKEELPYWGSATDLWKRIHG